MVTVCPHMLPMHFSWLRLWYGFASTFLCAALHAQAAAPRATLDMRELQVPGKPSRARLWNERGSDGLLRAFTSVSLDGVHFSAARETRHELELRFRRFDPLTGSCEIPSALVARPESRLFVVQYWTQGLEDYRAVLREHGAEVLLFLPHDANVVELSPAQLEDVRALPFVRAVTPFHPAFKLEPELLDGVRDSRTGPIVVNVLTTRRGGQAPVVEWIEAQGGTVDLVSEATRFLTASLALESLPGLAGLDDVQWIDRWGPSVPTMNIARELHGANHVEALHGLTGTGVRVEVLDTGCATDHPDLQGFLVHNGNVVDRHGTCTSGIVTGDGIGNPNARGAAPDSVLIVSDLGVPYSGGNRYNHTAELVDPALPYQCVIQSNSWFTLPNTNAYNSISEDLDEILFDMERISILTSQGNTATNICSPQAWAKNVIAVGALVHMNTLTMTDDVWDGQASVGPAADGRIKPDLASFYDDVLCTDRPGADGYSSGDYYGAFGGTSAATPIVAGHLALVYEMWHLGMFGNPHAGASPFENAPYNTTAKALLINSAAQWSFTGTTSDRTRVHQGWGHPDLKRLSDSLARIFLVDESEVLGNLQAKSYVLEVLPGAPSLRATLVYRDLPGTASSSLHRVNDLDLTLTSPTNTVYHGNYGLLAGTISPAGGTADPLNTVENVILPMPESGVWTVTVTATELNGDSHVETPELDADFALVVTGADELPPVPPLAPSHLRGRATSHVAQLAFRDNSNNEDGFELERSLDGLSFLPHASLAPGDTLHVDSGLTPGAVYFYRVRASNAFGTSDGSNVLTVRALKLDERKY